MLALIASLVCDVLIAVLVVFTRERGGKLSKAGWVAFAWLWFASSRNPTQWLQVQRTNWDAASVYDEGSALDRNVLSGIMLMEVFVLASRSSRTKAFLKSNAPLIAFFLYCGISVIWSDRADISVRRWFRSLGDLMMVMVVLTDADWVAAFKRLYVRLACFLIPLSILFFRFYPQLGRNYSIHDGHVSVTGVTDDKNALGMICMLFGLALVDGMLKARGEERRRKRKLLIGYGSVFAMALYIIAIANSATATACLILGSIVLVLTSMPAISRRSILVHLIVAGALGISAIGLFADAGLLVIFGRNPSLTGRTDLWALCLSLVTNPVVGAGYESFWLGHRLERMWQYIEGVNQSHNGYLEIYLNLGWVGVVLLVTLLVSGYRNILTAVRRREEGPASD